MPMADVLFVPRMVGNWNDLSNAVGGWFETRGWPGVRVLVGGVHEHPDLTEEARREIGHGGLIDLPSLPPSWDEAANRADYWDQGGTFDLSSLLALARTLGFTIEPLCNRLMLVDADWEIPF